MTVQELLDLSSHRDFCNNGVDYGTNGNDIDQAQRQGF